jgi:hypothetical protein
MSGVPVEPYCDDREESRREQLLAVRGLRRGLERLATECRSESAWSMAVVDSGEIVRELRELIDALDRRVPRVERAGEAGIARDAALLRQQAVKRIDELVRRTSTAARGAEDRGK